MLIEGRCGKKSFPTKKHRNTKSSMMRSMSCWKGSGVGKDSGRNYQSKYSRSVEMRTNCSGLRMTPVGPASLCSPNSPCFL